MWTSFEKWERVLKNGNDSWKSRSSFEIWELALKNENEAWLKWERVLNKIKMILEIREWVKILIFELIWLLLFDAHNDAPIFVHCYGTKIESFLVFLILRPFLK